MYISVSLKSVQLRDFVFSRVIVIRIILYDNHCMPIKCKFKDNRLFFHGPMYISFSLVICVSIFFFYVDHSPQLNTSTITHPYTCI